MDFLYVHGVWEASDHFAGDAVAYVILQGDWIQQGTSQPGNLSVSPDASLAGTDLYAIVDKGRTVVRRIHHTIIPGLVVTLKPAKW